MGRRCCTLPSDSASLPQHLLFSRSHQLFSRPPIFGAGLFVDWSLLLRPIPGIALSLSQQDTGANPCGTGIESGSDRAGEGEAARVRERVVALGGRPRPRREEDAGAGRASCVSVRLLLLVGAGTDI